MTLLSVPAQGEIDRGNDSSSYDLPDIGTFMTIGQAIPTGYDWNSSAPYFWSIMSGTKQIYRLNDHGWPVQLTVFEDGFDFFRLNYGGDKAIVGVSPGGSEQSQLYLLDTKTGRIEQITNYDKVRFGSVIWAKDDRTVFFRSNEETGRDYFLYQLNLDSGEKRKIFGDTSGVRGNLYLANISQDGQSLIVYHLHSNVSSDLYLIDIQTGEAQLITDPEPGRDVSYKYPILLPDNRTVVVVSDYNDEGIPRLARIKLGSYDLRWVDDGWLDDRWAVDKIVVSRDYRWIAAFINENGYVTAKIREFESKRELPMPEQLNGLVTDGFFAADSSFLFSFKGPTRAPDLWRWGMYSKELEQMTYSAYLGIDRELFTEPQLVTWPSFDSLVISAFLYLPPDYTDGEPIPFILHAHGGPESQFQPGFIRNIQYLLLHGYGVMALNPRGSSGYGTEFMALDDYQLRHDVLKDFKAAVDFLTNENYSSPGMIGIRGASYGGYVVLAMITEYPDLFSAAVASSGISNFQTYLKKTKTYRRAAREAEYGPLSDSAFLRDISPVWKADQIKTPLLVIHGENDTRVPVSEARQIIRAIVQNGGLVDSLIFPDEGHVTGKRENIIVTYRRQIEFFDKHLKTLKTVKSNQANDDQQVSD